MLGNRQGGDGGSSCTLKVVLFSLYYRAMGIFDDSAMVFS